MRKLKLFGLLVTVVLLAFGMTVGCSNGTTDEEVEPVTTTFYGTANGQPVEITFSNVAIAAKARAAGPNQNDNYVIKVAGSEKSRGKIRLESAKDITFIPDNGEPEFHGELLNGILEVSGTVGGSPLSVRTTTENSGTTPGGVGGGSYNGGGGPTNVGDKTIRTYFFEDNGTTYELTIYPPGQQPRAVFSLPKGSTYVLKIDGEEVSRGTVSVSVDPDTGENIATFTSVGGKTFTAVMEEDVAILTEVIKDDGTTVPVPDMGRKYEGSRETKAFVKIDDDTIRINFYGRGNLSMTYLPYDPLCDTWVLQNDANKGEFPVGKWVNTNYSDEYLLFTADTLTAVSPWFSTWRYGYSIESINLILTDKLVVEYIPTIEEDEYITNFDVKYEADFRANRPWIPDSSTIEPEAVTSKVYIDELGKSFGIDFHINDEIDVPFVAEDEFDIIGMWTVYDFVGEEDIEGYDPERENRSDATFWRAIRFNEPEGGVALFEQKRDGDVWIDWTGTWTKGFILLESQTTTASKYIRQNHGVDGEFLFVQWKSGDYTIRASKPYYYVFKKVAVPVLTEVVILKAEDAEGEEWDNADTTFTESDELGFAVKGTKGDNNVTKFVYVLNDGTDDIGPTEVPVTPITTDNFTQYFSDDTNPITLDAGDYTLSVYAEDSEGNKSNTVTVNFEVT